MLVGLADIGCHQTVGVVEAAGADAAVMHFCHQAVARNELHQNILTEELWGLEGEKQEAGQTVCSNQPLPVLTASNSGQTLPTVNRA